MIKKFIPLVVLFFFALTCAQNLNPTYSLTNPGSADVFNGGYTFAYATSGTPWNGSLISFGGFSNQYDTQLVSDYGASGGNHLSFRSRNGDVNLWNPWMEIYHSGNLNNSTTNFTTKDLSVNGAFNIIANGNIPVISGNGGYIPAGLRFVDDSYNRAGQVKEWSIFKGNTWLKALGFMRYDAINRCAGGICDVPLILYDSGDVSIGLAQNSLNIPAKLIVGGNVSVNAKLEAKEIKVTTTPTADFVFAENYKLPSLDDVEKHIKENRHLPEIASAKEMEKDGVNIGEFQIKLLQKIEELTLYQINLNKRVVGLEKENKALKEKLKKL